jgi:hypothetical protein
MYSYMDGPIRMGHMGNGWASGGLDCGLGTPKIPIVPLKTKRYQPIRPVDEFSEVAVPKQKCRQKDQEFFNWVKCTFGPSSVAKVQFWSLNSFLV